MLDELSCIRGEIMPKKGKKTKKSHSGAKRKLSKKFVELRKHKQLSERVKTLEKQVAQLQQSADCRRGS